MFNASPLLAMHQEDDDLNNQVAELIKSLEPPIPFPHKMAKEEEEMLYGERPPSKRGGRIPMFYRAEVEAIRQDQRPVAEIAAHWGVSFDTIQRVRQAGRFRHVPYIPRDEIDRRINYMTGEPAQPVMKEYPLEKPLKYGRPFKTGRVEPVTDAERRAMAEDPRHASIVAAEHRVSVSYVAKARRELGLSHVRRGPMSDKTLADIRADARPYSEIAMAYKIPRAVVERIKADGGENNKAEDESGV